MKSILIYTMLCCLSCLATARLSAQQQDIKSRVVDTDTGEGLEGVTVALYADAYWADTKITPASGEFFFEFGQKLLPNATLNFSFYKAGYEVKRCSLQLPLGEIALKRASIVIVRITDFMDGHFVGGIPLRLVSSPANSTASSRGVRTDDWGIASISIPTGCKDDACIQISIKGNDLYPDTTIEKTVKTLRSEITEVKLKPLQPGFDILKKRMDRTLKEYLDQLKKGDEKGIFNNREEVKRFRNLINALRNMTPAEKTIWVKYEEELKDIFEYFRHIEMDGQSIKINTNKYNDSVKLFDRIFDHELLPGHDARRVFQCYDREFYLGMYILGYDADHMKRYNDSRNFGIHAQKMTNLLEQEDLLLERYKDNFKEKYYEQRKTVILSQCYELEKLIKKPIKVSKS